MDFAEKRKYPRVLLDDVTVEVYHSAVHTADPELTDMCTILNVSENGMLFKANYHYDPGQLLRLTFLLPESFVIIRTDAYSIRCTRQKNSYEIGAQFRDIGLAEQKLISHFVNKAIHAIK